MRTILVLENSFDLYDAYYVNRFLETYEGNQIIFTGLRTKTDKQIWEALNTCDDIVVQTCFVNGSDSQFYEFLNLLSNIKESKHIHIALLGSDLRRWFDAINLKDIFKINHHKVFELKMDGDIEHLSFADRVIPYLREQVKIRQYKRGGKDRATGKTARILACNAFGEQFSTLAIGSIVDILDMSDGDENPNRGIWVWGKNEPIKLVNDCGLQEYEIIENLDGLNLLEEICKTVSKPYYSLTRTEILALSMVLSMDDLSSQERANMFCEEMKIEKRGNRQKIKVLLDKNLVSV